MIIGISGKIGSGKDELAAMLQALFEHPNLTYEQFKEHRDKWGLFNKDSKWQIKKFANPLKEIACIITGADRQQFEEHSFKEASLNIGEGTNRDLLIFLGQILNKKYPELWTKIVFRDYKEKSYTKFGSICKLISCILKDKELNNISIPFNKENSFPNWIISDLRFQYEAKAILEKGGYLIRINRDYIPSKGERCFGKVVPLCPVNPLLSVDKNGFTIGNYINSRKLNTSQGEIFVTEYKKLNEDVSETDLDSYDSFNYILSNDYDLHNLFVEAQLIINNIKMLYKT